MKPGEGPGKYLADCYNLELSDETVRQRWKEGDYGKGREAMRPDYALMYWKDAGRKT